MCRSPLLAAILVALPLTAARADAIYTTLAGNLGASSQTNGSVNFELQLPGGATFAQRFTTGTLPAIGDGDASGQILYRFSWNLLPAQGAFDPISESSPDLETTYTLNLFTNQSNTPGPSLFASGPVTGSLSAPGVVVFSYADLVAAPSIALQSNTSYWLTVAFQSASDMVGQPLLLPFTTGSSQIGPGTIDNLMVKTGGGWGGISERAIVQVQAEVVPEPSTLALAALSVAAVLIGGHRRRAQGVRPSGLTPVPSRSGLQA